jgi:hypothetical protein
VADHADRLALLEEAAHEADGVLIHPQEVRVGYATGQNECVVLVYAGLGDYPIHRERVPLVEVVEGLNLAGVGREKLRSPTRVLHGLPRLGQLDRLCALGGAEEGDLFAL